MPAPNVSHWCPALCTQWARGWPAPLRYQHTSLALCACVSVTFTTLPGLCVLPALHISSVGAVCTPLAVAFVLRSMASSRFSNLTCPLAQQCLHMEIHTHACTQACTHAQPQQHTQHTLPPKQHDAQQHARCDMRTCTHLCRRLRPGRRLRLRRGRRSRRRCCGLLLLAGALLPAGLSLRLGVVVVCGRVC